MKMIDEENDLGEKLSKSRRPERKMIELKRA